ncbi:MAG: hypothetical protein C5S48_05625 [Candidatus Methanogaster sp.]|nr:MAG: hypothetical protein C5S48_05625 [ANME-2 cluster archaeon]
MQDRKGKNNRLVQWFKKRDLSMWYLISFIVLILPAIIWNVKNIYFGTFEIDDGSARYLLSALLQSQAAIIAIVVTMTLVAVQLTASAYSPRVIDIFRNDRVMWVLLVWYGLSMFFGVFILETIGSEYSNLNPWGITVSLEFCVFLAYLMGIVAFAGLFWHVGNVINFLKPKNIIEKLSEDITQGNVLEFIKSKEKQREDGTDPAKDAPVQPAGLFWHVGNVINFLKPKNIIEKFPDGIIRKTVLRFSESKEKQRTYRTDPSEDDPVQPIVDIIHGSIMRYDLVTTEYGLKAITEKGKSIKGSNYEEKISGHFCTHLRRIGKLAVSIGDGESAIKVLESLKFFEELTAKERLDFAASQAAEFIGDVGIDAAGKELEDAAKQAEKFLVAIGTAAIEKRLDGVVWQAAWSLGGIGKAAVGKGLRDATRQATKFLGDVGIAAAGKELGGVGISVAGKERENVVLQAAWSLGGIGKAAVEKGLEGAALEATRSLGDVGQAAGFKGAALEAAKSIWGIGKAAVEKGLGDTALEAAKSLAELTISSEEMTKNTIQDYKSQLQEHDHKPSRKFMQMYEQELENYE